MPVHDFFETKCERRLIDFIGSSQFLNLDIIEAKILGHNCVYVLTSMVGLCELHCSNARIQFHAESRITFGTFILIKSIIHLYFGDEIGNVYYYLVQSDLHGSSLVGKYKHDISTDISEVKSILPVYVRSINHSCAKYLWIVFHSKVILLELLTDDKLFYQRMESRIPYGLELLNIEVSQTVALLTSLLINYYYMLTGKRYTNAD
jgi:hypothetical protein